jgi:hypothetical protein
MHPDPLPGYVWLDTPEKVLHVEERVLEFKEAECAATLKQGQSRSLGIQNGPGPARAARS